jgi:hypothetical protein
MNIIIAALLFVLAGPAIAQDAPQAPAAPAPVVVAAPASPDPLALVQAAAASIPAGKWAGKADLALNVSLGTWQSLKSTDQAFGISKRFFHLDKGGQTLVNVGLFAGVQKPIFTAPSSTPRVLGGDIIGVPGSTLDWALGTKWGDAWAPRLKTGVLFAHDLTRLAKTHLFGDFIGIGASYLIGGN